MSTLAQLAAHVVSYYDDQRTTDLAYSDRIAQVTAMGSEILDEVAQYAEWDFLYKKANLTFTSGQNYISLPSDFLSMPSQGKVIRPDHTILEPVTLDEVIQLREDSYAGPPEVYAITYQIELTTVPAGSAGTGSIYYQCSPTETTNVPLAFHNAVILQGMIARALEAKGEATPYYQKYRFNLAEMQRRLRSGKNRVNRIPMVNPDMY